MAGTSTLTLAVSSANALLIAIAGLSGGLLLFAFGVAGVDLSQRRRARRAALAFRQRAADAGIADPRIAILVNEGEAMLRRSYTPGPEWASAVEAFIGRINEQTQRLATVRDEALQLTLDELAFLTPKDESQVASLVALFGIRDRLEDDLKDAGYT